MVVDTSTIKDVKGRIHKETVSKALKWQSKQGFKEGNGKLRDFRSIEAKAKNRRPKPKEKK
jgi:hypothetical protein